MITKRVGFCTLLIGALASGAVCRQEAFADPPGTGAYQSGSGANSATVPSYKLDLREKYGPQYRPGQIAPSRRLDSFGELNRYRSGYRFAFPLDRYRTHPQASPFYYRRVTPYYDGRGYGVPSTSPFRYHRDLDGPIRDRRQY